MPSEIALNMVINMDINMVTSMVTSMAIITDTDMDILKIVNKAFLFF